MVHIILIGFILVFIQALYSNKRICYNAKSKGVKTADEQTILMQEYQELRSELKQRISQRDNFAIQFIAICGVVFTVFINSDVRHIVFILPVITMYYAVQIFSSYHVRERLVEFIRENLEKRIAEGCCIKAADFFWESYCEKVRSIEIDNAVDSRKKFFTRMLIVMPIVSFILYLLKGDLSHLQFNQLAVPGIYTLVCLIYSFIIVYRENHRQSYIGINKLAYRDYITKKWRTDEGEKAIFFDRDGTLHEDRVMTHWIWDLKLLPGVRELVKKAHNAGYKIVIVTNQSAIQKGYYSINTMHVFNLALRFKLKYVDAIYFCPHNPGTPCRCKKPKTGMIERAQKELNINLAESIMIGDRMSDIQTGINAGIGRNIFVATGIYRGGDYHSEPGFDSVSHETVRNLLEVQL